MGEILLRKKSSSTRFFIRVLYLVAITSCYAFPTTQEEESDREYTPPGAHQLASFILSQLRRSEYTNPPSDLPLVPYRIPHAGKRNSAELTSSIMGIPRNMMDNGKK